MNILKWVSWFVLGLISAIIYNKNFKPKEEEKSWTTEGMLFVFGWVGIIIIFTTWMIKKITKQ